jgi:curved DNA-binding protein
MAVAYQDYYEALGVPRDASEQDIRRAYRKLARENHPDVNKDPDAGDRFKQISEAYEVLRDKDKRARYDRLGANWKAGQDVSGAGGYEEAFRAGDGFGDVRVDFGGGDFSDFFEGFFGRQGARAGRGGGRGAGPANGFSVRGGDQEATLELTLEEAVAGGKRRLSLGDGRDFEVEIPPGVRDGQRIRLSGQGAAGVGAGPAGDLFLRIRIKRHPRFRVKGGDLYVDLPVSPWEAALGAEVPVGTLTGTARVRVPAGSSTGRRLRLRGEGLPSTNGAAGDLYAVLAVHVPKRLKEEERELFERLAAVSRFDPRKER